MTRVMKYPLSQQVQSIHLSKQNLVIEGEIRNSLMPLLVGLSKEWVNQLIGLLANGVCSPMCL